MNRDSEETYQKIANVHAIVVFEDFDLNILTLFSQLTKGTE